MTVFSPLWPGGKYLQRLVYAIGHVTSSAGVDQLGLIHFARLALIEQFPDHGQPPDDLRHPLQLFESNYNGSFGQYIDTFIDEVRTKMRAFWGTSYGFPWRLRSGPFKAYIDANLFPIDYYYARNPNTTVKTIDAALRVAQADSQLRRDASHLGDAEFAERFKTLVTDLQADL
jgi:hypothetical protein